MKKILALLAAFSTMGEALPYSIYDRPCRDFPAYWQREAYDRGFIDGFETGVPRNKYRRELDRIAYEIGFMDGVDWYERKYRCK
jgi:hypothetical protein